MFVGEILIVLGILALTRRIADATPDAGIQLDLVGTALSALGLGLIVFGILRAGAWGFVTPKPGAPEMLGSRAIWHEGWKAVTTHPTISGWGNFGNDTRELYHNDVDRAELHDLAAEEPERLQDLINLWYAEAGANGAFPLDDRSALEIMLTPRPVLSPARNRYAYYPGVAEVPESRTARGSAGTRSMSRRTGCIASTTGWGSSSRRP